MLLPIRSPEDLGVVIRKVRQDQGVRQTDLAMMVPASHVFIINVERGKPTAQIGKVLALLRELGIELFAEVPESESEPPND